MFVYKKYHVTGVHVQHNLYHVTNITYYVMVFFIYSGFVPLQNNGDFDDASKGYGTST